MTFDFEARAGFGNVFGPVDVSYITSSLVVGDLITDRRDRGREGGCGGEDCVAE
jgi:hypothetical protein